MNEKTLPTIDIKGKEYVLVKDRIAHFNELYPNGAIQTIRLVEENREIVKAEVIPDCDKPNRFFTGWSQAQRGDGYINKTSALENAETSAVGRALAMMGIWIVESIASADEINKANAQPSTPPLTAIKSEKKAESKPWFNPPQLEELSKKPNYILSFPSSNDLINELLKTYSISFEMRGKLGELHAEKKLEKEKMDDDLPF